MSGTRIIAHRGASGYLPEHTTAAKAFAYGQGADFIEQDVVATRDHELVVLHDIFLDDVSNVAARYPKRRRDDGRFYVIDFTLAELRELRLIERRRPGETAPRFPARFPFALPEFRIVRFEDEIALIAGLNASTSRRVGIYPEIKEPGWHQRAGIDLTALVHQALVRAEPMLSGPVFIQSFDAAALRRLGQDFATPWPLVQLLLPEDVLALASDPDGVDRLRAEVQAVGLPFETLIEAVEGRLYERPIAAALAGSGLLLHPYTMRRDVAPPQGIGYAEALRFLMRELKVDALFCDHPDDALAIRDGSGVDGSGVRAGSGV